jgi:SSS family solute:Na+ symporter
MPIGLVGLLVAALLAVVMSTASSYLNSIAVVFTKDIYLPFVNPRLSRHGRLWTERALSVVVGVAATVFAVTVPSIVDALLYSYSLWAPTVIIPLLAAVLFGVRSRPAALSAIVVGGAVTAVVSNLVVFIAVAAATPYPASPALVAASTPEEVS